MFKKVLSRTVWIVALFVVLGFQPARAQSALPATGAVEIVGTVQSFDGTAITINGQRVSIIGAVLSTPLTIGAIVKVEGILATDGSVIAREVNTVGAADMHPGEVEIVGTVTALQDGQLTVNGQTIDVSAAEIKAGVAVGQIVKVEGTTNAQGQLVAREVGIVLPTAQNSGRNGTQITGTLDQIGDGFIVVSGQQISTANAEINSTLTIGTLVEVKLTTVNGQVVAREIEAGHAETEANDVNDDHGGLTNGTNGINDNHGAAGNGADDPAGDRSGGTSGSNSGTLITGSGSNNSGTGSINNNSGSGSNNGGSGDSGSGKGGSGGGGDNHGGQGDGGGHK